MTSVGYLIWIRRALLRASRATIRVALVLTLLLQTFLSPVHASNQIPKILNYQARVTDSGGVPVSTGTINIWISAYDAASGGSCLYAMRGSCGTPSYKNVPITNGVFSLLIGDMAAGDNEIPESLFDNNSVYLGVTVASDTEMVPRKRVTAAPYALNSDKLDDLDASSSGSSTPYIVATTTNGNLTITGDPQGASVGNGSLYINPATAAASETLLGIADNGSVRYLIDKEGDITHTGSLLATSASSTSQFIFRGATSASVNIFEVQDSFTNRLFSVSATSTRFVNRLLSPAHANNQGLQIPTNAGVPAAVTGSSEGDVVWDSSNDNLYVYTGAAFTALANATTFNLNHAYLNSTSSAEISLSPSIGAFTIADTFSGTGNIFEVQDRTNATGDYSRRYFTVSATATSLTSSTAVTTLGVGQTTDNGSNIVVHGDNAFVTSDSGKAFVFASPGAGALYFSVNGLNRFLINSSGNASFGHAVPNARFNISQNAATGNIFEVNDATTGGIYSSRYFTVSSTSTAIGNASSTYIVTPNARFAGNLTPSADATYNLGDPALRWKDLWLSDGSANIAYDTSATSILRLSFETSQGYRAIVASPSGTPLQLRSSLAANITNGITIDGTGNVSYGLRLSAPAHANNSGLLLPTFAGTPVAVTGTAEGDIVWNSTSDHLYVYNGAAFTQIDGSSINLNQAYLAATSSAEISLSPSIGAVTIADTFSGTGSIFEVQNRTNSTGDYSVRYFTVSSTSTNLTYDSNTTLTAASLTANALTTGNGLSVTSTSTGLTGSLLLVQTGSTSTFSNGGARFNFTGAHNGAGVQIDDASTNGTPLKINANSLTTGDAVLITANALGSGAGSALSVVSSGVFTNAAGIVNVTGSGATDGTVMRIDASALTGGAALFVNNGSSYTGGQGVFALASNATSGTVQNLTAGALTTGIGLSITSGSNSTTSGKLLSVTKNDSAVTANFTGAMVNVAYTPQYTTTNAVSTGSMLSVTRNSTMNGAGLNPIIAGPVALFSDTTTLNGSGGVARHGAAVVNILQTYKNATGTALTVTSSATGAGAAYFNGLYEPLVAAGNNPSPLSTLFAVQNTTAAGGIGYTARYLTVSSTNTMIGNTSSTYIVTPNARFAGNLTPSADATYNLGDPALRWRDLWLSGGSANIAYDTSATSILRLGFETSQGYRGLISTPSGTPLQLRTSLGANTTNGITIDGTGNVSYGLRLSAPAHANNSGFKLPANAGAPAAVTGTTEGDIVWDSTSNHLYVYDGASFTQMDGGTTPTLNQVYLAATSSAEVSLSPSIGAFTIADTFSGTGNIFEIQDRTNATGDYSVRYLTVSSTSTNLAYNNVTTGIASNIDVNGITTGKGLNISSTSNGWSSGTLLKAALSNTAGTASLTGSAVTFSVDAIYSTAVSSPTNSGNVLALSRSTTTNGSFVASAQVSGAVLAISDQGTATTGSLNSSASVVEISENYTNNNGTALNLTTAGSGGVFRANDDGTLTDSTPFFIKADGTVNIGGTSPQATLDVEGGIQLDIPGSTGDKALCSLNGGTADDEIYDCISAPAADYMEMYPAVADLSMGDIVMPSDVTVSASSGNQVVQVTKTISVYEGAMLGVISNPEDAGDFNSIGHEFADSVHTLPVALKGRVKVKVNMENGTINVGDPITSSSAHGVGMKSTKPGMIVGQALEAWSGPDQGMILVFMGNGFHSGLAITTNGVESLFDDNFTFNAVDAATVDSLRTSSFVLNFKGSAWDSASSSAVTRNLSILNETTDPTNYQLAFRNNEGNLLASLNQAGNFSIAGTLSVEGGFDYAEMFPAVPDIDAGDIVMVDGENANGYGVKKSSQAYENALIGVVSTKPGFLTGKPSAGSLPIALAGRVPVKVNDEGGAIKAGDPITSSSTPGVGMKATTAGRIVGIALEGYEASGTGRLLLFINPSWWNGPMSVSDTVAGSGLVIQNDSLIDFKNSTLSNVSAIVSQGGLWSITSDGYLTAAHVEADSITTAKLSIKADTDTIERAVGTGRIAAGKDGILIQNPLVTADSIIIVTFETNPGTNWWIDEKHDGLFTLKMAQPAHIDQKFTYWIMSIDGTLDPSTVVDPVSGLPPPASPDTSGTGTAQTSGSGTAETSPPTL